MSPNLSYVLIRSEKTFAPSKYDLFVEKNFFLPLFYYLVPPSTLLSCKMMRIFFCLEGRMALMNSAVYRSYRLEFPTVRVAGNAFQVAEVQLIGQPGVHTK